MAEFLHFSRDTRVYAQKDGRLWQIPVLDGFSFSQTTNTSEITLSEMEDSFGRSRRGMKMFTDSLSAAEWSFSTYMRPFKSSATGADADNGLADDVEGVHHAVDEVLWANMAGRNVFDVSGYNFEPATNLGGGISHIYVSQQGVSSTSSLDVKTYVVTILKEGNSSTEVKVREKGTTTDLNTGNEVVALGQFATADEGMRNAAFEFTVDANGNVTNLNTVTEEITLVGGATEDRLTRDSITERGTRFVTGDTVTINSGVLTGDTLDTAIEFTIRADSFDQMQDYTEVNFHDSNRAQIGTFTLYFIMNKGSDGRLIYVLENAVCNEVTVDFDVDGLATTNWSGFAGRIKEMNKNADTNVRIESSSEQAIRLSVGSVEPSSSLESLDLWIDTSDDDSFYIYDDGNGTGPASAAANWYHAIEDNVTETGNFIRNRLTQLTIGADATFDSNAPVDYYTTAEGGYSIPLTGGSFTITNNVNYLTPEELGLVNQPIEHVTGTRGCSGSMTCYLGASDLATNRSKDLFNDLVNDTTSVINEFELKFKVGGSDTTNFATVEFVVDRAHLEIPTHSVEDVISLEANFAAQGSSIGETDEVYVRFRGV